jgi:asparagine synthase (glutamine-hydrolysing)
MAVWIGSLATARGPANEAGTLAITYNGEIFNFRELRRDLQTRGHRFRSDTDTEVLLHLYESEGPACVTRLNGMFAFAIWDIRDSSLFFARDHFGVKPLYYASRDGQLALASEAKALFCVPGLRPEVDVEALDQYMTMLWVPDPRTLFKGILKLPAGHYALFKQRTLKIVQYWDLTFPDAGASYHHNEAEQAELIRDHLRRSVRSQMVSDVPLGAFLSAGLDSTSIVAMMAETGQRPLRTYTITFPPTHRVGETTLDDPKVVASVAAALGAEHHEIVVEPRVADLLPRLVWHMDEPVADPAILADYLVCREARSASTVLLSGVGGDEMFAGYRKHYAHYWAEAYRRLPQFVRAGVVEPLVGRLPALRGTRHKGLVRLVKKMVAGASLPPVEAFLMSSTYLDGAQRHAVLTPEIRRQVDGFDPWCEHRRHLSRVAHADVLHQMLYLDTKTFMVSLNLTYNDKMSMASSVEVRVPFLDRQMAEFAAWHVPPHSKLKGFFRPVTKAILRRAMKPMLPDMVMRQPKAGFFAPVDYWLANDLREMVDDLLSETRLQARGYFQPAAVRRFIDEHRRGRHDWSMQIWQFLTFELWLQAFVDAPNRVAESVHA